jgi:CPA1 family monovalent cation:H+ antiporter
MPEDATHAEELHLARCRGSQAALAALPTVADEVGIGDDLRRRLQKEYEEKAALVLATENGSPNTRILKGREKVRRVRLGVLEHKRREITSLRNQNLIDDIVLRELQNEMDLEEVQLLAAAADDDEDEDE